MNRFQRVVLAGVALTCSLLNSSPARAQSTFHPSLFALSRVLFPSNSQIVRTGVESNQRLMQDDPPHFGLPPGAMGRATGFYMDAVQGDPAIDPHPYTSYLISIFHAVRQARRAFSERWDTWFEATYYTTPSVAAMNVGDPGAQALFHTLDPSQPPLTELLFRRGAVVVEVFQGTVGTGPSSEQLRSFSTIATQLDTLAAQHPLGV
jgi:hypothetical protein